MKKILTEDTIKEAMEALIRIGSYGIVIAAGWKITDKIAANEIAKNNKISELKLEVLDLKCNEIESKINELKNK